MRHLEHFVPNRDGWHLSLHQTWDEDRLDRDKPPVLIVPGYGMNSFIFSFHPRGVSLEGSLVQAGFEVWRVDLRGQGESRSVGGADAYTLEDLAEVDLGVAIDAALERTRTTRDTASILGCSLGGTLMFLHAALNRRHRIANMIAVGSPVRWVDIHPLLRVAFASPTLVGLVRLKGTRRLAEVALPHVLKHTPWVLSLYMNPDEIDHSAVTQLVKTVEDPNRVVNKQIARWIRERDLLVGGHNLTLAVRDMTRPLLCVVANGDGIVPRATAEYAYHHAGAADRELLAVGDDALHLAHADMFVSNSAHERVFKPVADWLLRH